ncbi:MAG: protein TolQ, partial [Pseudomonadales bacterium]|nr:protein TolQ [Pseudomonadales bacterium]
MVETMSIWELVLNASVVVKIVMAILMLASVVSWVMIFQRFFFLGKARRALRRFEDRFWSGVDLGQLFRDVSENPQSGSGAEEIFRSGIKEYTRLT